jgi:hypothetical protein
MYITLDCGTTWISVDTNAVSWPLGQFTLVTNNNNLFPPINGMKFTVTNAAAGNTLAVIVTGTG